MQDHPDRVTITQSDDHYVLRWYAARDRFQVILTSFKAAFPTRAHATLAEDRWFVPMARKDDLAHWVTRTFENERIACDDPDLLGHAAARRHQYALYLDSEQWALTRAHIQDRERRRQQRPDPLCECCWTAPGTEVHHEHYQRVFAEALFELRWVCHPCNQRLYESEKSHGIGV